MSLPRLSHLQFLVLRHLLDTSDRGRGLRGHLREHGIRKSGPAFYQLMSRLEDGGFVRGWYEQEVIDGQIIRERWYEITAQGREAWLGSREFYMKATKGVATGLGHGSA